MVKFGIFGIRIVKVEGVQKKYGMSFSNAMTTIFNVEKRAAHRWKVDKIIFTSVCSTFYYVIWFRRYKQKQKDKTYSEKPHFEVDIDSFNFAISSFEFRFRYGSP